MLWAISASCGASAARLVERRDGPGQLLALAVSEAGQLPQPRIARVERAGFFEHGQGLVLEPLADCFGGDAEHRFGIPAVHGAQKLRGIAGHIRSVSMPPDQTTPNASIASATFLNPAILAPRT